MAARKGRRRIDQTGRVNTLYARISDEAMAVLDAGAAALGISRVAFTELFIRRVEVDDRGLPDWVHEMIDDEQLPLLPPLTDWVGQIQSAREGPAQNAA